MSKTLAEILNDTRTMIATKQASFGKKAEITGQCPSSMPGAEHDSKTPDEAKKPHKEVRDGSMAPAEGYTASGAGDDSKITHTGDLTATEAATEAKKKPAVTADADAKEAEGPAKMANELVGLIRDYQKQAEAPKVEVKVEPKAEPVVDKKAEPKVEVKKEEPKAQAKEAGLNMELTSDVMAKIAAIVLSTEEGAQVVESILQKQAGAEAADVVLNYLAQQAAIAEKQAMAEQGARDAQELIDRAIFMEGVKAASAWFKGAQAAPAEMPTDVPGAAPAAGAMAAPAEGAAPGGADEEVTVEDVVAALESLVADGTIKPEEAQAVMAQLMGAGGEGAAPAPGEGAAPEAPKAEPKAEPSGDEKAAALLDRIQKLMKG